MNLDDIILELESDSEFEKFANDSSAPKDPAQNGSGAPADIVSVAQEVMAIAQNFLASLQSNQVAAPATQGEAPPQEQQGGVAPESVVTLQIPASAILKTASIRTEAQALAFFNAIGLLKG